VVEYLTWSHLQELLALQFSLVYHAKQMSFIVDFGRGGFSSWPKDCSSLGGTRIPFCKLGGSLLIQLDYDHKTCSLNSYNSDLFYCLVSVLLCVPLLYLLTEKSDQCAVQKVHKIFCL